MGSFTCRRRIAFQPVLKGVVKARSRNLTGQLLVKFKSRIKQVFNSLSVKGAQSQNRSKIHLTEHNVHPFLYGFFSLSPLLFPQIPLVQNKDNSTALFKGKRTDFFILLGKTFNRINQKKNNITLIKSFDGAVYRIIFNIIIYAGLTADSGSIKHLKMLSGIIKLAFNNIAGRSGIITYNRSFRMSQAVRQS